MVHLIRTPHIEVRTLIMKLKYRFYVLLSSYTWAIIGLFLTGSLFFFVLPVAAIIYIFMGGKKHV